MWHERQRWLLWILWAHVAVISVYAVILGHVNGTGGLFLVAAAAFAVLASLPLLGRIAAPRTQSPERGEVMAVHLAPRGPA